MAGNTFGFQPYAQQRPSIPPAQVGAALQRRVMGAPAGGAALAAPATPMAGSMTPMAALPGEPRQTEGTQAQPPVLKASFGVDPSGQPAAPPQLVSELFAGGDGGDVYEDSAVQAARLEAKTRIGSALATPQQRQPAAPFALAQLQRMGLSDAEIRLMQLGGSVK